MTLIDFILCCKELLRKPILVGFKFDYGKCGRPLPLKFSSDFVYVAILEGA